MPYTAQRWNTEEKFWKKIGKCDEDSCWGWEGCLNKKGYGTWDMAKRKQTAHRWAYIFACGPIPDGMGVLHHCDNPGCVNPKHLFLGTNADNVADKVAKGRQWHPIGELHHKAKLNRDQVLMIREMLESGMPGHMLAVQFGVSRTTIYGIRARKDRWLHV